MPRSPLTISLYVPDVAAAVEFYRDILGFELAGTWEEEGKAVWAEVARDAPQGTARVWFFSHPIPGREVPMLSGLIYIFVEDVDAEAEKLKGKVAFRWGPENQEYGLRELGFQDPHGYLICFARDVRLT